jgi:Ras-related protein Rab-11A
MENLEISEVSNTEKETMKFKTVIIGEAGVGKTSIVQQFVNKCFQEKYVETIGVEFFTKTFKINDKIIKAEIWDTAGSERFASITKNYYRGADGALIVYDISNKTTFDNVENWFNDLKNACKEEAFIILIGNKNDLENQRQVSNNMLINLGKNLGIAVMETSAKDDYNINESFYLLIKEIYRKFVKNNGSSNEKNDIGEGMVLKVENTKKKEKGGCCGKKNDK